MQARQAMCWSGPASFAIAAVGVAATATSIRRGDSPLLWAPLMYFTAIEVLQGYSYSFVGQCALPQNQVAALLAYIHIAFQPLVVCCFAGAFIPSDVRKVYLPVSIVAGSLAAAYLLIQVYPFDWAAPCRLGRVLCSEKLCVMRESWHLGWHIPMNDVGERVPAALLGAHVQLNLPVYTLVMFGLPILFGAWRIVLYQLAIGPSFAWLTTDSPTEFPAIWCLFSLGIVMLVVFTPLRDVMRTDKWLLWDLLRRQARN
ncbi:DUF5765 domain-containing protein [Marimonas sp. MJW-29]|uniref:DUF5765 domain-containing protein n=1 Tax=Sulfitobacter sediminis TaxID=3234186 RepID=A0ABV3RTW5_9RHOB